ncbi:hypothetical protein ACT3SP_10415 [Brachybacterium sp. AOP43-C2-M15]|uniref:hypothetical protein n=1 Tax=Brachybacterium sp. AOP43-C2-M15 TaxID=3457661 RepID=UPI00403325B5
MYGWMFRHLPGPLWARILIALVLLGAVIAVLFTWVFPAIAPFMPFNDGLVGAPSPEGALPHGGAASTT